MKTRRLTLYAAILLLSSSGSAWAQGGGTALRPLWSRTPDRLPLELHVLSRGILIGVTAGTIDGMDAATGAMMWRTDRIAADSKAESRLADRAGQRVAVLQTAGEGGAAIWMLDVVTHATGTGLWSTGRRRGKMVAWHAEPRLDLLYVLEQDASGNGMLSAFKAPDGTRVWQTGMGPLSPGDAAMPGGTAAVVWGPERIYRVDQGESPPVVYAMDRASGQIRWVSYLNDETGPVGLSWEGAGLLATGTAITSLDPSNGAVQWRVKGAWAPLALHDPWLLVRRWDEGRLQMIHRTSGQTRWRGNGAEIPGTDGSRVAWTRDGVLVGWSGGATVSYEEANGRRGTRQSGRYETGPRTAAEVIAPLPDGMLFAHSGPTLVTIVRTSQQGSTQWTTNLPSTGMEFATPAIAEHWLFQVSLEGGGSGILLWSVVSDGGVQSLVGLAGADGRSTEPFPILRSAPVFAVDGVGRRLFYLDAEGRLAAAGW